MREGNLCQVAEVSRLTGMGGIRRTANLHDGGMLSVGSGLPLC